MAAAAGEVVPFPGLTHAGIISLDTVDCRCCIPNTIPSLMPVPDCLPSDL